MIALNLMGPSDNYQAHRNFASRHNIYDLYHYHSSPSNNPVIRHVSDSVWNSLWVLGVPDRGLDRHQYRDRIMGVIRTEIHNL
jgi:hypothetical protein